MLKTDDIVAFILFSYMNVLHIFRSVELAPTLLVSSIFTFMLFHVIFRSLLFCERDKNILARSKFLLKMVIETINQAKS